MNSFGNIVRKNKDPSQQINRCFGENMATELTLKGHNYTPLAYFFKLSRDMKMSDHEMFINQILLEAKKENDPVRVLELFLLTFHTRNCRGGKGDKKLFYQMINIMYCKYPKTVLNLVEYIPEYGYWKDTLLIIKEVSENGYAGVDYSDLKNSLYKLIAAQIILDYEKLNNGDINISLVGKWCPRENKYFHKNFNSVSKIIKIIYPEVVGNHLRGKSKLEITMAWNHAKKLYSNMVTKLSKALEVPEILMCAKKYSKINFSKNMPSLCLNKNMKLFLNQTENGDIRYPNDPDRIECAENLISNLSNLKGKMLFPNDIVGKILNNNKMSHYVKSINNVQWEKVRENIINISEQNSKSNFSELYAMCDVSGSMYGKPMEVAIALSILISEINKTDLILTFSENCEWVDLKDYDNIYDKVNILKNSGWGMNTNFYKAMENIAQIVRDNNISKPPNLIVFSDMQFNNAGIDNWDTIYEKIEKLYYDLGIEMDGIPKQPPKIIFWNLRSNTVGYPVDANQKGVITMSGYNPALMKYFLNGELDDKFIDVYNEDTGEMQTIKKEITPLDNFKNIMNDKNLLPIRNRVINSDELLLANFMID